MAFEVSQRKHLPGRGSKFGDGFADELPQFTIFLMAFRIIFGNKCGDARPILYIIERYRSRSLSAAQEVERGVNRRPRKIRFGIIRGLGCFLASRDAQKNRLQDILGVGRTARHPISRAKNTILMALKQVLEAVCIRNSRVGLPGVRRP